MEKLLYNELEQLKLDRNCLVERTLNLNGRTKISNDFKVNLPINIPRILLNAQNEFKSGKKVGIRKVIETVTTLCIELEEMYQNTTEYTKENTPDTIKSIYKKGAELICISIRYYLHSKKMVKVYKFSEAAFTYIINTIRGTFGKAIIHPGEMAGPLAASSIAEPTTQLTLNTFHYAGVSENSNVNSSVPRLKELLDVTSKLGTPSMSVFLKPCDATEHQRAKEISFKIEFNTIDKFYKSAAIWIDPVPFTGKTTIAADEQLIKDFKKFSIEKPPIGQLSKVIIRFTFKRESMIIKNMRLGEMANRVRIEMPELYVITSDDNAPELVMRIHLIMNRVKDKVRDQLILAEKYKSKLMKGLTLRGIRNVTGVDIKRRDNIHLNTLTGEMTSRNEYLFYTVGTNFQEILKIPEIDYTRTITNNVNEVYSTLGIEAARRILLDEFMFVFESNSAALAWRHLYLLVDIMTYHGFLVPINRSGMKKSNNGPFQKMSFEEMMNIITKAGVNSEYDDMSGISGNLVFTQPFQGGTNAFDVLWDNSASDNAISAAEIDDLLS